MFLQDPPLVSGYEKSQNWFSRVPYNSLAASLSQVSELSAAGQRFLFRQFNRRPIDAWMRVARRPYTEDEEDEARANLVKLLDRMETAMEGSGWLVGDSYSIADIAAVPFVKRIDEEIAPDEISDAKHPRVAHWWASIQARPAFERANIGPFVEH